VDAGAGSDIRCGGSVNGGAGSLTRPDPAEKPLDLSTVNPHVDIALAKLQGMQNQPGPYVLRNFWKASHL
jgi:hypothetical protein